MYTVFMYDKQELVLELFVLLDMSYIFLNVRPGSNWQLTNKGLIQQTSDLSNLTILTKQRTVTAPLASYHNTYDISYMISLSD